MIIPIFGLSFGLISLSALLAATMKSNPGKRKASFIAIAIAGVLGMVMVAAVETGWPRGALMITGLICGFAAAAARIRGVAKLVEMILWSLAVAAYIGKSVLLGWPFVLIAVALVLWTAFVIHVVTPPRQAEIEAANPAV